MLAVCASRIWIHLLICSAVSTTKMARRYHKKYTAKCYEIIFFILQDTSSHWIYLLLWHYVFNEYFLAFRAALDTESQVRIKQEMVLDVDKNESSQIWNSLEQPGGAKGMHQVPFWYCANVSTKIRNRNMTQPIGTLGRPLQIETS